jgi:Spx/MgsR family transcriptional regulator
MSVTLYGLKNCDTCKKALKWLQRHNIAHVFIDYREQRQSPQTLAAWAQQAGGWDALINKSSTTWRQLPPPRKSPGSAAEWQLLLREYPQLIRRPVLITGAGQMMQGFTEQGFKQHLGVSSDKAK